MGHTVGILVELASDGEVQLMRGLLMASGQKPQLLLRAEAQQAGAFRQQPLFKPAQLLAKATAQAGFQFIQPLRLGVQTLCGVLLAEPLFKLAGQLRGLCQPMALTLKEPGLQPGQAFQPILAVGADGLRSGRGGGRTEVGDEIADGEIDFMADRGDDRDPGGVDRPRHPLLVEGPEILGGAPAASKDQHFALFKMVRQPQGMNDLVPGFTTLDLDRVNDDLDGRKSTPEHGQDVADGGAGRGGNHADGSRQLGNGLLVRRVEQALGAQFDLEPFEGLSQRTLAGGLKALDDQLVIAARFIQADLRLEQDMIAVARELRQ